MSSYYKPKAHKHEKIVRQKSGDHRMTQATVTHAAELEGRCHLPAPLRRILSFARLRMRAYAVGGDAYVGGRVYVLHV